MSSTIASTKRFLERRVSQNHPGEFGRPTESAVQSLWRTGLGGCTSPPVGSGAAAGPGAKPLPLRRAVAPLPLHALRSTALRQRVPAPRGDGGAEQVWQWHSVRVQGLVRHFWGGGLEIVDGLETCFIEIISSCHRNGLNSRWHFESNRNHLFLEVFGTDSSRLLAFCAD